MSLAAFENYIAFVDKVLASRPNLPAETDAIELESILVSHGVSLLYARMEQCFQEALETKCNRCTDAEVRTFALSVKSEKTGKLMLQAVKRTCKRFGVDHKLVLTPELERLNIAESWDSVVNVRQRVAHHGERASLTLSELRGYYRDIRKVLGCICKALTLNDGEVETICKLIEFPIQPARATSQATRSS